LLVPEFKQGRLWFKAAARLRAKPVLAYGAALLAFGLALGLRFAVNPYLAAGFPYLTFFPAVMLTTFFCGIRPGILCGVLSVLAAWYWFIAPNNSFALDSHGAVAVAFFIFIIAADIVIIGVMHGAVADLMVEQQRTASLLELKQSLFEELQHRTANNLSFVSALLQMHKRRSADQPQTVAALDDASLRLDTMSNVHRRLYDPAAGDRPLDSYLRELLTDVLQGAGRSDIVLDVGCKLDGMELNRLLTVSLVVVEMAINSAKHALVMDQPTSLSVLLGTIAGTPDLLLSVRDNGPGFAPGFDPSQSDRLGFRILKSFARSLDGTLSFRTENGAVTEMRFPARATI
jgi:two-component sensor histidine kinase